MVLLWIPNFKQKLNFMPQLVFEILQYRESWILIGLEVFRQQLKNYISQTCGFWQKVSRPLALSYSSTKSTHEWIRFLSQPQEYDFWTILGTFFSPADPSGIFFQKSGSVTVVSLSLSNFMHKIRKKKLMAHFWYFALPTDGRTEGLAEPNS